MKTINYTGSSKLISRIVNLLNRRAPLPLDGDGDPVWGTNGQVLSTDGNGNTAWVNQGGGGSGGHTIWNRIKSALTQRGKLWFADASVSDVSADDATKVEVVTELASESAFDNLATDGSADGIYAFPDSGGEYLTAEMVGYENTNVKTALDGKVNRSGDTMTGNLYIDRQNGTPSTVGLSQLVVGNNIPSGTAGNSRGAIVLYGEGTARGAISAELVTSNKSFYLPDTGGTLCVRTVTTLVNETANIPINTTKTYATLTLTALQAYDEVHFMLATGNVLFNGMWTKGQMNFIASISAGKMYIYGGQVVAGGSVSLDYKCKVYADSGGLKILNQCSSAAIDKVLVEGIKYN